MFKLIRNQLVVLDQYCRFVLRTRRELLVGDGFAIPAYGRATPLCMILPSKVTAQLCSSLPKGAVLNGSSFSSISKLVLCSASAQVILGLTYGAKHTNTLLPSSDTLNVGLAVESTLIA